MVTLFLGMDDWVPTKFAEGYSRARKGRVWDHPLPPRPPLRERHSIPDEGH